MTITKECVICHKEIETLGEVALCSLKCKKKHARIAIENMDDEHAFCPTCGKSGFESITTMLSHHNQKHLFTMRQQETCEECGEKFVPKNSKNPNKYCSEKCFGLSDSGFFS